MIEFFFDFVSPYAYFAATQIENLAARYARAVQWKPTLIGVTITKVMGLKPLTETPLKSGYVALDKPRMAQLLGIPFTQPNMKNVKSIAASRAFLAISSADESLGKRFAQAVFSRLWVDGLDITSPEAVAQVCDAIGVDTEAVLAAIQSADGKDALKRAVDEAVARSIFGTPFFVVDRQPIWGVDRLWMLEHWLKHRSWDSAQVAGGPADAVRPLPPY